MKYVIHLSIFSLVGLQACKKCEEPDPYRGFTKASVLQREGSNCGHLLRMEGDETIYAPTNLPDKHKVWNGNDNPHNFYIKYQIISGDSMRCRSASNPNEFFYYPLLEITEILN